MKEEIPKVTIKSIFDQEVAVEEDKGRIIVRGTEPFDIEEADTKHLLSHNLMISEVRSAKKEIAIRRIQVSNRLLSNPVGIEEQGL